MTHELTMPSKELAERLTGEVGFEERLVGVKMNQMGGANATALFSLEEAASFVKIDRDEVLSDMVGKVTVGYIDPNALARWIEGVFGDEELAAAIHAVADEAEFFADAVPPLKELLAMRLEQCREMLTPAQSA